MYCISTGNSVKYNKIYFRRNDMRNDIINAFQHITLPLLIGALFMVIKKVLYKRDRLTHFFISANGDIVQSVNSKGKKELQKVIIENKKEYLNGTMHVMARFLFKEFSEVLKHLDIGKTYNLTTHIKSLIERAERKGTIEIISCEKGKRKLLIESIRFLGIIDFIRVLRSKEHKHQLFKQFYKMKIKKIK